MCRAVNLYQTARGHAREESILRGQRRGNLESYNYDPEHSVFLRY
jgi:hypothetical protein